MKKMVLKLYFLLFFAASPLVCHEDGCFYSLKDPLPKTGMFAVFQSVLCLLDIYDTHRYFCSGIEVNFGTEGLYWTEAKGPNWWRYYFNPICINKTPPKSVEYLDIFGLSKLCLKYGISNVSRNRGNYLIRKYIKVKSSVQKKAYNFYKRNLQKAYVIGIHYRGTDKVTEAPRVSYDQVYDKIVEVLNLMPTKKKVKIFVATDESQFISYIVNKFPNTVYHTNAKRAADSLPVHIYHNKDPYKNGAEALVDCLLLSKCNVIIRTESHLSNTALMFNPNIVSHTLNSYTIR